MTDRPPDGTGSPPSTNTGSGAPAVPGVEDLVEIGRGGFGVVYRGHQADLGRDVAVKVLLAPGVDEKAVERWRREVTAMGRLSNHPNIVGVFSAGVTDEGHPYLVMPYAPGGSLHDRVGREGPLAPEEAARLAAGLAAGLAAAHDAGVLHRDVKPANVLLSEYGEPQLTDFGIARLADAATTTTTSVQATVGYAAPEILSGDPATPASDVYGLGATLHAVLAAQAPFAGPPEESLMGRIGRVMTQPPPDLRAQGVPPALADLVARCLAKDPADRPATAEAVRRELESLDLSDAAAVVVPATGPVATEVLQPVPVVPAPAPVPAAAAPPPPADDERPGSGAWAALAVAVVALVVVAGLAGWWLTRSDGTDTTTAGTTEPASATTEAPVPTENTAAPTEASPPDEREPSPTIATPTSTSTTEPPAPTEPEKPPTADEAAYRDLVDRYYGFVDDDELEDSYALLSPGFQARQDFEGYEEFWEGIESVSVQGRPSVDVAAGTVELTLRYELDDRDSVEDVRLSVVEVGDGRLLIDTYEVLRTR